MKIKYCLLLIITACVIVFACRKAEFRSNSSANSQLVDAARKWFEEKHTNDIATIHGFVANGRLTSRVKNVFAGEPDWKLARPYMGNLGILVVLDSRNDRKGHVMFRDLLITKDSSGGFKEYIQSVYFDSAYISSLVAGKGKLADIRSYSDPGTFTGRVILTTVYNQLVRGAVFENGQLVKGIEPTARALRNKKINPAPTVNLYSSVPGSAITPVGVDIGTGGDLDDNNGDGGGGTWNDNDDNSAGSDVNVTSDPKPTLPPGTGPIINPPLPDPGNYSPTIPPNYGGGGGGYKQQPPKTETLIDSVDSSITKYYPCLDSVIQRILRSTNNTNLCYHVINEIFGESQALTLNFKALGTSNKDAAYTIFDIAHTPESYYGGTIIFPTNYLNRATTIDMAATLFHEVIHAYLDYKFVQALNNQISSNDQQQMIANLTLQFSYLGLVSLTQGLDDYPALQSDIIQAYNNVANNTQHEQMAQTYIQTMVDALRTYDNAAHSDDFYTALAWGGLQQTDTWKQLPSNGVDTAKIDNINFHEEQGDSQAQGKKCGTP